ncbi:MAG: UUP1 family membrane protein [Thermodesulfobacteriota bacterium]
MKRSVIILAAILLLIPILVISYRVFVLRYPFFPVAFGKVWHLSMETRVVPKGKEIAVEMGLPANYAGSRVIGERVFSGSLNFNFFHDPPNRFGYWSGTVNIDEAQTISYDASVLIPSRKPREKAPTLEPYPPWIDEEQRVLAANLASRWLNLPPPERLRAVVAALSGNWGDSSPSALDAKRWQAIQQHISPKMAALILFRAADLPARPVEGLLLDDTIRRDFHSWVEVWTGKKWESVSLETGKVYTSTSRLLPLAIGGYPALTIIGGEITELRWNITHRIQDYWRIHFEHVRGSSRLLDRLSLFNLPAEFQQAFRILLLVPIAALIISFLRNVVGFPTFGIFMPVLMALAFRNTGLGYGLGIFTGIMLLGYALRWALDKLHLLLVPRLSVILTFVILALAFAALWGSKLDVKGVMAVGLLPIVILTMTIERFFILIEEAGLPEAVRTVVGSAVVASLSYWIINKETVQFVFYFYPELLLAVAGGQLLLGRYTGFRLSEIFRFRAFREAP